MKRSSVPPNFRRSVSIRRKDKAAGGQNNRSDNKWSQKNNVSNPSGRRIPALAPVSEGVTEMAIHITRDNFQNEVMQSEKTVLLDFYASWCGPCKMLSPILDEVEAEASGTKIGKINIDDEPELAAQFGVMSVPTLVVMQDGVIQNTAVGVRPKEDILQMLTVTV